MFVVFQMVILQIRNIQSSMIQKGEKRKPCGPLRFTVNPVVYSPMKQVQPFMFYLSKDYRQMHFTVRLCLINVYLINLH